MACVISHSCSAATVFQAPLPRFFLYCYTSQLGVKKISLADGEGGDVTGMTAMLWLCHKHRNDNRFVPIHLKETSVFIYMSNLFFTKNLFLGSVSSPQFTKRSVPIVPLLLDAFK